VVFFSFSRQILSQYLKIYHDRLILVHNYHYVRRYTAHATKKSPLNTDTVGIGQEVDSEYGVNKIT